MQVTIGYDVDTGERQIDTSMKPTNHVSNTALSKVIRTHRQGHTYEFSIYARDNNSLSSAGSNTLRIIIPTVPSDVLSLWSTETDETSLTLNWNVKPTNETSFSIFSRIHNSNGPYIPHIDNPIRADIGRSLYSHTIKNLTSGTSYDYYVLATNSFGESLGLIRNAI
jgi:hypothetical protein